MVERGIVAMKGKGDQKTYWLVGEDPVFQRKRKDAREKRRAEADGRNVRTSQLDSNGHYIITRSSLKNKNSIVRSPIPRCSSFESPKRLRFASTGEETEKKPENKLLEVISDNSPCKKSSYSYMENSLDCCSEAWKTSSTSCPCIENLANSAATLAQSQLSMFSKDDKSVKLTRPSCYSVPTLCSHLTVPHYPIIHTISAPTSPRKQDLLLSKFPECEEVIPWMDSTPLLKITKALDSESCV